MGVDARRLERILAQIRDADDRAWLVEELVPAWRRRRRRLEERDRMVRELAIHNFAHVTSGRELAVLIGRSLGRYASSAFRFERDGGAPADLTRRRLWTILRLNNGRPMSTSSVRDALAGGVHRNQAKLPDSDAGN